MSRLRAELTTILHAQEKPFVGFDEAERFVFSFMLRVPRGKSEDLGTRTTTATWAEIFNAVAEGIILNNDTEAALSWFVARRLAQRADDETPQWTGDPPFTRIKAKLFGLGLINFQREEDTTIPNFARSFHVWQLTERGQMQYGLLEWPATTMQAQGSGEPSTEASLD